MNNDIIQHITWSNIADVGLTILYILLSVLAYVISTFFRTKAKENKKEINNKNIQNLLDYVENIVEKCVISTNQTFVDNMKEDGMFNANAQELAFKDTLNQIKAIISDSVFEQLKSVIDDEDAYLGDLIENKVVQTKHIYPTVNNTDKVQEIINSIDTNSLEVDINDSTNSEENYLDYEDDMYNVKISQDLQNE